MSPWEVATVATSGALLCGYVALIVTSLIDVAQHQGLARVMRCVWLFAIIAFPFYGMFAWYLLAHRTGALSHEVMSCRRCRAEPARQR